jgi:hypothetical protein
VIGEHDLCALALTPSIIGFLFAVPGWLGRGLVSPFGDAFVYIGEHKAGGRCKGRLLQTLYHFPINIMLYSVFAA